MLSFAPSPFPRGSVQFQACICSSLHRWNEHCAEDSHLHHGVDTFFIVQPETLLRWHRQGFKLLWKYKSRSASPTPRICAETVALIREMARDNQLWGAELIRGELLNLGIRDCMRTI